MQTSFINNVLQSSRLTRYTFCNEFFHTPFLPPKKQRRQYVEPGPDWPGGVPVDLPVVRCP